MIRSLHQSSTESVRCKWCGRKGVNDWQAFRTDYFRTCVPACTRELREWINREEMIGLLAIRRVRNYPLLEFANMLTSMRENKEIDHMLNKAAKKSDTKAAFGKTATEVKAEVAQRARAAKANIAAVQAALKKAKPITGKTPLPTQAALVGKWLLYMELDKRKGQFGDYYICRVVETSEDGTAAKGSPFKALIGGSKLTPVLAESTPPFLAKIVTGTNRMGKEYYVYV